MWNGMYFYGNREFDVAGFGGAKKVFSALSFSLDCRL